MSESITARVGRIISGSLNAIVDSVENATPETVMEQAIREVESAIDEVRLELGRVIAGNHLANNRLLEENRKHEELSSQIQVAIKASRDDLAEVAVSRQMDIEAQLPVLEVTIAEALEKEKELEGYVQALRAKKREMQDELKLFKDSQAASLVEEVGSGVTASADSVAQKVEKAGSAFDRVMGSSANLPAATGMPDAANRGKLAELEALSRKNRIEERLAAIKSAASESP